MGCSKISMRNVLNFPYDLFVTLIPRMPLTSIRALKACGPTVGNTSQTNLAIESDRELSHNGWESWYFKDWFTQGPSSHFQFTRGRSVQSQFSRAWKLGAFTSHGVPSPQSQVRHKCLHDNTFWR